MNLASIAAARAAAGKPVRVGLIGAGKFGSMFLAQAPTVAGLHVAMIADLDTERAKATCKSVGWDAARIAATRFSPKGLDVCTADVDVVINAYGGLRQGIERNEIRALATTTATRIPQLPDIPTAREAGVADFEVTSWNGLYAPVGTPPEVVATLSKAITEVLSEKDIQQRHRDLGLEVSPTPADRLAKRMRSESDRWGKVINESGIEQQ